MSLANADEQTACSVCGTCEFLPLTCAVCARTFCRDHIATHGEQCSRAGDRVLQQQQNPDDVLPRGTTLDALYEQTMQAELAEKQRVAQQQQQQQQQPKQATDRHAVLTTSELPIGLHRGRRLPLGRSSSALLVTHHTCVFLLFVDAGAASAASLLLRPLWIDVCSPSSASVGAVVEMAAATLERYLSLSTMALRGQDPALQLSVAAQIPWVVAREDGGLRTAPSVDVLQQAALDIKSGILSRSNAQQLRVFSITAASPEQKHDCRAAPVEALSAVLPAGESSILVAAVLRGAPAAADAVPAIVSTAMMPFWRKNLMWLMLSAGRVAPSRNERDAAQGELQSNNKNAADDDVPPPPPPPPPPSNPPAAATATDGGVLSLLTAVPWMAGNGAARPILVGIAPTTAAAQQMFTVCYFLDPSGALAGDGRASTLKVNTTWIAGRALDFLTDRATRPTAWMPASYAKTSATSLRLFSLRSGAELDLAKTVLDNGVANGDAVAVGVAGTAIAPALLQAAAEFDKLRAAKAIPRPLQARMATQCIVQ